MHYTAKLSGSLFAKTYGKKGFKVVDIGGMDVNGTLREFFENMGMTFISVDMVKHPSVDIIIKPTEKLPFDDNSIDLVISTSCFEHDPCFWITFREMCRIVKLDGYIYVNAPSNGYYHGHPGDNWRFYADAGQSLAYWSGIEFEGKITPVKVIESFHINPSFDIWRDYVCIWQRTTEIDIEIKLRDDIKNTITPLKKELIDRNISIN